MAKLPCLLVHIALCLNLGLITPSTSSAVPLQVYFSWSYLDNAALVTSEGIDHAKSLGYNFILNGAEVSNSLPPLRHPTSALSALYTYFNPDRNDTAQVASADGVAWAEKNGYQKVRVEAYVSLQQTGDNLLPLKQYWSVQRNDSYLVSSAEGERSALAANYELLRIEGYAPMVWVDWPSTPPDGCPFEPSDMFSGVSFSSRYSAYGHADTWYPSWAADGNLYSSWTDGSVNGIAGGNGQRTTGFATIIGDDPLNLNITQVGTFFSPPNPYQGRYPSANLVHNGVWYYGTYSLENPQIPPNPPPNCGNWCVQGPFIDFRYATSFGPNTKPNWLEPRVNMTSPTDNLFGETAMNNSKVKFGAPHVVDFGQESKNSPDGKMYIVGHGATRPEAHQSWMQGDSVYMGRVEPSIDTINKREAWEFFAGHDSGGAAQWTNDLSKAEPIFVWNNHTGVVTMTYVPEVKRYIMVVSTPTFSPYTVKQFDTYLIESRNITGPFKLISYMKEFGPEAYFVNIPSKFTNTSVQIEHSFAEQSIIHTFLSFSANFAFHGTPPNPPGSGYHWTLQEMAIKMKQSF